MSVTSELSSFDHSSWAPEDLPVRDAQTQISPPVKEDGDVNTPTEKAQQVLAYSVVRFLLKNVRSNF